MAALLWWRCLVCKGKRRRKVAWDPRDIELQAGRPSDCEVGMLRADSLSVAEQLPLSDRSTASRSGHRSQESSPSRRSSSTVDASSFRASSEDEDCAALVERREGLAEDAAEASDNFGTSSMVETMSMLTEGIFREFKLFGIMKLGVYEHWVIQPKDIRYDDRFGGKGSFGEVQHAFMYGGTEVALKTAIRIKDNQTGLAALANEVRLLRRIRHPNIVLFHGVLMDNESHQISLVLEWVEGANLDHCIRPRKRVVEQGEEKEMVLASVQVANIHSRKLLEDVTRGMQYLHAQTPVILHRDLKPANILIEKVVSPPRAKIADFGLSVLVRGAGPTARAGTAAYMAPEVQRRELYSMGADVFSFGCVVLFVFVGRHPDPELLQAALENQADSRSLFDWSEQPQVRNTLSKIASVCLREGAEERPDVGTVMEMLSSNANSSGLREAGAMELSHLELSVSQRETRWLTATSAEITSQHEPSAAHEQ